MSEQEIRYCRLESCGRPFTPTVHNQAFHSRDCTKEYTNKKILQQYHDRKNRDLKNRTCAFDGCGTILSIYNSEDLCGAHQQREFTEKLREWGWDGVEDDFTL